MSTSTNDAVKDGYALTTRTVSIWKCQKADVPSAASNQPNRRLDLLRTLRPTTRPTAVLWRMTASAPTLPVTAQALRRPAVKNRGPGPPLTLPSSRPTWPRSGTLPTPPPVTLLTQKSNGGWALMQVREGQDGMWGFRCRTARGSPGSGLDELKPSITPILQINILKTRSSSLKPSEGTLEAGFGAWSLSFT